jgi:transposase
MGRINRPILDEEVKSLLERGYRTDKNHSYRLRCQLILLKAEGRSSEEVGGILKLCSMSVNNWTSKFKDKGIAGLQIQSGRGRKPILSKEEDADLVIEIVKKNRQRLSLAKAEIEKESGKQLSNITLQRFLKVLTQDTNV